MYELVICTTNGTPLKRFDLANAENAHKRVVIGRAEDCDIRITSAAISRHHCAIEPDVDSDGEDWIIRDLGSAYGVELEGVKIAQADVKDGLEVRIGPAVLKFQAAHAKVAAEIAREVGEGR
jgi:pSer/pThr/pTyr-binding forkhead associated (FHA) protein